MGCLIKLLGCGDQDSLWNPAAHVVNCPELVQAYWLTLHKKIDFLLLLCWYLFQPFRYSFELWTAPSCCLHAVPVFLTIFCLVDSQGKHSCLTAYFHDLPTTCSQQHDSLHCETPCHAECITMQKSLASSMQLKSCMACMYISMTWTDSASHCQHHASAGL